MFFMEKKSNKANSTFIKFSENHQNHPESRQYRVFNGFYENIYIRLFLNIEFRSAMEIQKNTTVFEKNTKILCKNHLF